MRNYKENPLKSGEIPSKDELYHMYIEQNISRKHLATYLNISMTRLSKILKYYGITKPQQLRVDLYISTSIEKYGVDNPAKNEHIKEKIKQTNMERYGVEYYSHIDEYNTKVKQTCMERYGVDNPAKNEHIKAKIKQTNIERYGTDNPLKNEHIKEKIKQTNIERYGVDNPSIRHIDNWSLDVLHDKQKLIEYFEYNRTKSRKIVAEKLGVSSSAVDQAVSRFGLNEDYKMSGTSSYEEELVEYIKTFYSNDILRNQRILNRKEIDIYLPDIKFGIEFNGDYWHSEIVLMKKGYSPETYHIDKYNIAKEKGIYLHHIYEHEYNINRQVVLDILKNLIMEII